MNRRGFFGRIAALVVAGVATPAVARPLTVHEKLVRAAARLQAKVPLRGIDVAKLNNPQHQSMKYRVLRILDGAPPISPDQWRQLNAIGVTKHRDPDLRFNVLKMPDGTYVDVFSR